MAHAAPAARNDLRVQARKIAQLQGDRISGAPDPTCQLLDFGLIVVRLSERQKQVYVQRGQRFGAIPNGDCGA